MSLVTRIGFTGTRKGLTQEQSKSLSTLFEIKDEIESFHFGDCVGADHDFYELVRPLFWTKSKFVGHIPENSELRVFLQYHEEWRPRPYLDRNRDIVRCCTRLIACPGEKAEQPRSGTWSTIRYAVNIKRPVTLVYPDGEIKTVYQD